MARRSAQQFYDQRMRSIERRRILRPMTAGEIIDAATRAYQTLAGPILRNTLVPMLFCFAGLLFYGSFVAPNLFETSDANNTATQLMEVGSALLLGLVVALPLFLIGLSFATGLTVRCVSDYMVNGTTDISAAVTDARGTTAAMTRLLLRILVISLGPLAIGAALLFLSNVAENSGLSGNALEILPGILGILGLCFSILALPVFLFQFSLAPAAVIFEGAPPKVALHRSRQLMRSLRYHTNPGEVLIYLLILLTVAGFAISGGLGLALNVVPVVETARNLTVLGPFSGVAATALEMLPAFVTLWLLVPVYTTTVTILYFDRIMRLEAYDIKLLAQDVLHADRKTVLLP